MEFEEVSLFASPKVTSTHLVEQRSKTKELELRLDKRSSSRQRDQEKKAKDDQLFPTKPLETIIGLLM